MDSRLSKRLAAGRRRRFIGRQQEMQFFSEMLSADELPYNVIFVYGPGGVGKSTLLSQFTRLCRQMNVSAYPLDARNTDATPDSFCVALAMAMGIEDGEDVAEELNAHDGRQVILVDTYELMAPLDSWLRDVFLPDLPESLLFVTAGRNAPSHAWRSDPGWQPLVHLLPLRNLSPDEGRSYLLQREVPEAELNSVLTFTHSYPLALSLVADLYDQRPGFRFRPEAAPDVVKALVGQLLERVPGAAHRAALEACALVRVTTESLLAAMFENSANEELFEWLRTLTFVDTRPGGLFPHDLAREALVADLRWRHPARYADLHRRARGYYIDKLSQSQGAEQQLALFDLVFLHRDNPVVRPVFEWQASGRVLPSRMEERDLPQLVSMVARHEGTAAAQLAQRWCEAQPDSVLLFREVDGSPVGFLLLLNMSSLTQADIGQDPALAAADAYLRSMSPLRPGDRATYFRFWMAKESHQSVSPTQSLIFINMVRHYLSTQALAFTFIPCAEPDFWQPVFAYADLARLPAADFEMDGHRYGVFGHDWRTVPPVQWLDLLGERELAMMPQAVQPPAAAERLVVLSEEGFAEAVRTALQEVARPDGLADNPLLRSRLPARSGGRELPQEERIQALRNSLLAAVDSLQHTPRDLRLYRALYHTYVKPVATQELAAELIDVPFSSYRRHLKSGIERVVEQLWRREVGS